jgi:hypothetical protein
LNYTAAIVGTARDVAPYVEKNMETLINISNMFLYCPIVIYENDSGDNTKEILRTAQRRYHPKITIITESNVPGNRTTRLAHGRNQLHDHVVAMNIPFDYYIVCDLDDKMATLSPESILTCFEHPTDTWSMMGANQEGIYYDLWALRTKDDWCDKDCWDSENGFNKIACNHETVPRESSLIEVDSCFGGTAVYKFAHTIGCRYQSFPQKFIDEICEHVPFHESMRRLHGARLFINPKMINS